MPGTGFEPARLATHAPQACVSTNFTTRARSPKVRLFPELGEAEVKVQTELLMGIYACLETPISGFIIRQESP